jgi:hypothetical protein
MQPLPPLLFGSVGAFSAFENLFGRADLYDEPKFSGGEASCARLPIGHQP